MLNHRGTQKLKRINYDKYNLLLRTAKSYYFSYLWKDLKIRIRDIHVSQSNRVDSHGGFENLVGAVALVLQLPSRSFRKASTGDSRDRKPPLVFLALQKLTERGPIGLCGENPLINVPELRINKTVQYILQNDTNLFIIIVFKDWVLKVF